jgi:hypothetical protein
MARALPEARGVLEDALFIMIFPADFRSPLRRMPSLARTTHEHGGDAPLRAGAADHPTGPKSPTEPDIHHKIPDESYSSPTTPYYPRTSLIVRHGDF